MKKDKTVQLLGGFGGDVTLLPVTFEAVLPDGGHLPGDDAVKGLGGFGGVTNGGLYQANAAPAQEIAQSGDVHGRDQISNEAAAEK